METKIKKEEVMNNSKQPYGIQTPQNVEEFRNNLKKYFVCIGDNDDELYVQNCDTDRINVNELNSLTDLYQRRSGMINPTLSPKVNPKKDFKEFMNETNQIFSLNGYFDDENNYEIIEDRRTFLSDYEPKWVGLDNQIYREFYYLTLG
ncbi:MAG: hypothetical protein P8I51_07595, partial [Polaribacter sp.]|nr:hypothetical protein [Polaribacter sp.]